ncbi:hypothetical protein NESM_000122700 [Novymonas esmeraldas]|uniref:Dynactin subunit 5 n=1 Tax=Novymonas esmeraldas TaxID=1808958 RepID=A0AAW0F4H7_9TRYP
MQSLNSATALIPPLLTSGALNPLEMPVSVTSAHSAAQLADAGAKAADQQASVFGDDVCIRSGAIVHSDMCTFTIGAYSVVCAGAVLRPPIRVYVNQACATAAPQVIIGSFTFVGEQVVCEAAEIGHMVRVDAQCVVSTGAHLPDGVWLLPQTWVPPEVTLSPYTIYGGAPATPIRKLNAHTHQLLHMEFLRRQRGAP